MNSSGVRKSICVIGALAILMAVFAAKGAAQVTIDKQITIQPIQVRSTDGTTSISNPSLTLYEAETDRIWSQAGIDILFLPTIVYNNSLFLNVASTTGLTSNELVQLRQTAGESWSLPANGGTLASTVIRLFFVQLIDGSTSNLGYTLQSSVNPDLGGNPNANQQVFMAIADNAFALNRLDVIAHELGHALALDHTTQGAGGALNLMTAGGTRIAPTFIGDIYPNGAGTDQLIGGISVGNLQWQTDQIDRARVMPISQNLATPFVYNAVPEPATNAAIAGALVLGVAGFFRRRRLAVK